MSLQDLLTSAPSWLSTRQLRRSYERQMAGKQARNTTTLAAFDQLEQRLAFAVGYATVNDWGSGVQGQLTLANDTTATLTDWQMSDKSNRSTTP